MAVFPAAGAAAVAVRARPGSAHKAPAHEQTEQAAHTALAVTARVRFGRPARVGVLGISVLIMAACDLVLTLDFLFAGAM